MFESPTVNGHGVGNNLQRNRPYTNITGFTIFHRMATTRELFWVKDQISIYIYNGLYCISDGNVL